MVTGTRYNIFCFTYNPISAEDNHPFPLPFTFVKNGAPFKQLKVSFSSHFLEKSSKKAWCQSNTMHFVSMVHS